METLPCIEKANIKIWWKFQVFAIFRFWVRAFKKNVFCQNVDLRKISRFFVIFFRSIEKIWFLTRPSTEVPYIFNFLSEKLSIKNNENNKANKLTLATNYVHISNVDPVIPYFHRNMKIHSNHLHHTYYNTLYLLYVSHTATPNFLVMTLS